MFNFMFILIPVIFAVVAVASIVAVLVHASKAKNTFSSVGKTIKDGILKVIKEDKPEDKVCDYCGCRVTEDDKDCPSCGAKIK